MNSEFDNINNGFDNIDSEFDNMNTEFDNRDTEFDNRDSEFDNIDSEFDNMNTEFDNRDTEFDDLNSDFDNVNNIFDKINVEFIYLPVINFAMQQNRVSVIRTLAIGNSSEEDVTNLRVSVAAEPAFAATVSQFVEIIPAGETVRIETLKLNPSTNFFAQLTERMSGSLILEIRVGEELLLKKEYRIDMLAFDQWGGISVLPEMLSSFITPNHPALLPVIHRTGFVLEQWTGNPSLDEYLSRNPNRVRKQMAAVYAAIAEQNIVYSSSLANFEAYGQRIRLTDAVLSQKLGNCLDMALLYASCLESIGLHPIIIIVKGHAFAGAWLTPETFPDSVTDDIAFLNKRIADGINEITLVETTCMNRGIDADFDRAVQSANKHLLNPADFLLAIDVKRTRLSGIRPLPQRTPNGEHWEVKEDEEQVHKAVEIATPKNVNPYDLSGISSAIQVTKQLLWERKLLDLSLRNNLLNVRMTKNTLQLISADLHEFEDALTVGNEFRILPKPSDWEEPIYKFGLYQALGDHLTELIKSEITQRRLRSYLAEPELSSALSHLYRSSRLSIEENGANTLYVALGLLKWFEHPRSERPRYAPILLLPVEIIRKSAANGYIIRSREEDTMMNITLLEMLRQNFGITIAGLDPLPVDHNGVDVKLVYSIVRNGIIHKPKWDVEEQAILGIFSFNKFIMWNDIHNNAKELQKNKIVSSLISGKIEWEVNDSMVDASALDKELQPSDIMLPISADSSQLESIYEAIHDKSYILHGPPGTGKSQTITNIIANALYQGKRVLFVAEKMAALSVVQNRLTSIGLAPFCLELHSNKTKKTAILSQLKATSEVVKKTPPENFAMEAARLLRIRKELNTYIEALHRKYPIGISLYDAITRYLSIENSREFTIPQPLIRTLTKELLVKWQDAVGMLISVGNSCGHPHNHPLTGINIAHYSAETKEKATELLAALINVAQTLEARYGMVADLLGERETNLSRGKLEIVSDIIAVLLQIPELTPAWLTQQNINEAWAEYRSVAEHGRERDRVKEELLADFSDEILAVDARHLLQLWNQHSDQWFMAKYFGQRKVRKQLNIFARHDALENAAVKDRLNQIIKYQDERASVLKYTGQLSLFFGRYGKDGQEDWTAIVRIVDESERLNTLMLRYANDIGALAELKENLAKQLTEGIRTFGNLYGAALSEINTLISKIKPLETQLFSTLGVTSSLTDENSPAWLSQFIALLTRWFNNMDKLKDWYQWLLVCNRMEEFGLGFAAEIYKDRNLPTEEFMDIFNKSVYRAVALNILSQESDLDLFQGKLFNDVIRKYKTLTSDFEELTRKELYAKLASNIPSFTVEAAQTSEVGILQRNIRNNGRGISIRKLFDQIPTLLSRMCPCMLMSPISVAQYIDPYADKFDLIVFDEASQMPTAEAVGAIARGKNIVIVGDPKQLPPTTFFSTNVIDVENIEIEDMESILDDCLALSMPSKHLLWHYRSRHESLIAFSNAEYYANKLLTFPSPDNIESRVRVIHVDGFYDKGKTRQNRAEAQIVIDEIERRLSDENLRGKSIGVVTFSSVQQSLIDDMLSELFLARPELEPLALECEEPLFIKNLENVQGDERDVILFSIGYGPDMNGVVSMNFGPLNRSGGERRLNVALSRARYEMIVYTTLKSEHIDLNRTSSVGVAGLKRFLEYAEKDKKIAFNHHSGANRSVAIENIIAKELVKTGYTVHTNIGSSGYKINIGIVDKNNPSQYILGILCDGETYRQTKTANDREIIQNMVLRQLGWNIFRVWTMDWWEKPQQTLESIVEAIEIAETNAEIPPVEIPPEEISDTSPLQNGCDPNSNSDPNSEDKQNDGKQNDGDEPDNNSEPEEDKEPEIDRRQGTQPYRAARLSFTYPSDYFWLPQYKETILSQIHEVVETEAPVSRALLCRRILTAWGMSRLGIRLNYYFDRLFVQLPYYRKMYENGLVIFWKNEEQCNSCNFYRPNSHREAADLPPEEIANAMKQLVEEQIGLPINDLIKLTAQLFGFARATINVSAAMHRGLKEAVRKNYIKIDNDRAVIV
jgi:DNA polymerase III delta prime subunit